MSIVGEFPCSWFLGDWNFSRNLTGAGVTGRVEFDVCLFAHELKNGGNIILANRESGTHLIIRKGTWETSLMVLHARLVNFKDSGYYSGFPCDNLIVLERKMGRKGAQPYSEECGERWTPTLFQALTTVPESRITPKLKTHHILTLTLRICTVYIPVFLFCV